MLQYQIQQIQFLQCAFLSFCEKKWEPENSTVSVLRHACICSAQSSTVSLQTINTKEETSCTTCSCLGPVSNTLVQNRVFFIVMPIVYDFNNADNDDHLVEFLTSTSVCTHILVQTWRSAEFHVWARLSQTLYTYAETTVSRRLGPNKHEFCQS